MRRIGLLSVSILIALLFLACLGNLLAQEGRGILAMQGKVLSPAVCVVMQKQGGQIVETDRRVH